VAEQASAEQNGRNVVEAIARFGETKGHLRVALDAVHTAMAITPLGMGHVTVLGDLAKGIAAQLVEHNVAIEQFAQKVTVETGEKGAA